MIADGLLDFRIAIPTGELDGDFHDKFGIFRDSECNAVAFHGSPNDSERAFRNYEVNQHLLLMGSTHGRRSVSPRSWSVFEFLWTNGNSNLRVYPLPDAVKRNLISFTNTDPATPTRRLSMRPNRIAGANRSDAVGAFFKARHESSKWPPAPARRARRS